MLDFLKTAIFITKILIINFFLQSEAYFCGFLWTPDLYVRKQTVINILDGQ